MMGNCHCRDCQRARGSAYAPAIGVPVHALKITGEVRYHEARLDNGKMVSRGYGLNCGARLFVKSWAKFMNKAIYAASLDDRSSFKPVASVFTSSAQPRYPLNRNWRNSPSRRKHEDRKEW